MLGIQLSAEKLDTEIEHPTAYHMFQHQSWLTKLFLSRFRDHIKNKTKNLKLYHN